MAFLNWNTHQVAKWIASLGFPQYKLCFTKNFITGRKLVLVDCNTLPRLGITDFKDMMVISAAIRKLLGIKDILWTRSIADTRRDLGGLYLEQKSRTGQNADSLTYKQFLDDLTLA